MQANAPVPVYSITLPDGFKPPPVLTLSLAVTEDEAPLPGKRDDDEKEKDKKKDKDKDKGKKAAETTDSTVELQTADGKRQQLPLSRFGALLPPFKARFTKFKFMDDKAYEKASEPIFQTFEIPGLARIGLKRLVALVDVIRHTVDHVDFRSRFEECNDPGNRIGIIDIVRVQPGDNEGWTQ